MKMKGDRQAARERGIAPMMFIGAVVLATLTGCSGTGPSLMTGATAGAAAPKVAADMIALSPEEIAAQGPSEPLNPFNDITGQPLGGREVIASPTLAEVLEPATPNLPEMSWGKPDAPVVLVKYMSLTCPHCRTFHTDVYPKLKRDYIDTGKVRFILREFPIGRTSGQATVALRCAPPEKYLDLYSRYLGQQPSWVAQEVRLDPIYAVASQVGLSRAAFDACRQDVRLVDGLKLIKDRGRKLGIIGTPNFFIGNKLVKKSLDWPSLQAEIDPLLTGGSTAAEALTR